MLPVTIVLPNRNHAEELSGALAAIAAQTVQPAAVILIDDCSSDDSRSVCEAFAAEHPYVRFLVNDRHLGTAGTVTRGIELAQTEFVLLASADEEIRPTMVERLSAAAAEFPDADLIVSAYTEWWPESGEVLVHDRSSDRGPWYAPPGVASYCAPADLRAHLCEWFVWLGSNTALYRRKALLDVGGLDPALGWHSDWFATYAIAFRTGFVTVPESLALFRMSEESYSHLGMRSPAGQRMVAREIQRKLRERHFTDFRRAIRAAPAALSPFLRPTIEILATRPRDYDMALAILRWWIVQVFRGRRPGFWARWLNGGRLPGPKQPPGSNALNQADRWAMERHGRS